MKTKVGVLGCGWLGKPLAEELLKDGYCLKASYRNNMPTISGIEFYKFAIHEQNIPDVFWDVDSLIIAIPEKNIDAFTNIVSFIINSEIKHIVFCSSTGVYSPSSNPIYENSERLENELFHIENLLQNSIGDRLTIARLGGLVGYNREPGRFFKNQKPIPNPEGVVNLIHRDDAIACLKEILKHPEKTGAYNLVASAHPKRLEFYQNRQKHIGLTPSPAGEQGPKSFKKVSNRTIEEDFKIDWKYADLNFPFQNH